MTPLTAVLLAENSTWWDLMAYLGIGFSVVLSTLGLLALICTLTGRLIWKKQTPETSPPTTPFAQPLNTPAPASAPEIPEEHLLVIAAAVATVIQQPHRLTAVRHIEASPDWTRFMLSTWSVEGRSAIFSSHRIR